MNENFGLYLILTDPVSGYEKAAEAAVNEGVRYLQLRMKNHTDHTFLAKHLRHGQNEVCRCRAFFERTAKLKPNNMWD